jgi:hypothetical protein
MNNENELNHLLPEPIASDDFNLDASSIRSHPLWGLALSLAPILNPDMAITEASVKSLLPKLETYSKNLDLHFRDENRQRVALYSALATRYASLAGKYQEISPDTSSTYLKASMNAHKAANQAAKDAARLYTNLVDYSHLKFKPEYNIL